MEISGERGKVVLYRYSVQARIFCNSSSGGEIEEFFDGFSDGGRNDNIDAQERKIQRKNISNKTGVIDAMIDSDRILWKKDFGNADRYSTSKCGT
jgi:hypothetical protein